ncbi:hypothetical protein [Cupriavidus basilensis]
MDRQTVYPGQIPLEADLLNTNKFAMIALAKLAAAMLGTATVVNGLACVPTGPASLQVVVNPGEIYSLANIDATAYSSLPADTAHSILKQGISLDAVTLSCPAPVTAGQSVNYLIQAAYLDTDAGLIALPYYNASNPTQAWSGPNNSGAQQATVRKGIVNISAKTGVAATTGSQVTPAPDAGYTGLWVVTVANGQSTITSANITQAANAPTLPADLLHAVQQSALTTAVDTGSANTYVVSYSPAITALTDGMVLSFKVKTANTGASTLNVNGLGAQPLVGGAHSALQGGEMVANGKASAIWRADISSFVLLECTGGALQVAPGTQSNHAAQFSQVVGVVGTARNVAMNVAAASATATLTAAELVVKSALGGFSYLLSNFSKTINLATTGAGGMDTGTAPVSGYVAIYAIYNPTTGASALLGVNAATLQPEVYGGANMPSGYTASALVSVRATNASGQFTVGYQVDRHVTVASVASGTFSTALTDASTTLAVPNNAKSVDLATSQTTASGASQYNLAVAGSAPVLGGTAMANPSINVSGITSFNMTNTIYLLTARTVFITWTVIGGSSPVLGLSIAGYSF